MKIQISSRTIILAILIATIAHYAGSTVGMDSVEAIGSGIMMGCVSGALSMYRKPVAKVALIGAGLGAIGSIAVQLLSAQQGIEIQPEYVLLFAALVGLLGVLCLGFWTATGFVIRRLRQ